jgi:hypothetical protein
VGRLRLELSSLREEMASLRLEANAATTKAQRYRQELKEAQASVCVVHARIRRK